MSEADRYDQWCEGCAEPPVSWRCDTCKYDNAWDDNFCRHCGEQAWEESDDDE